MSTNPPKWDPEYAELVSRNIGLLTDEQQERLRSAKVSVCGMGGLGGTLFEVLVRSGIGRFSIVDKDTFEASNLNRQVFAFRHTLGQRKIDAAEEFAKAVNPAVQIDKYDRVGEDNAGGILRGCDVVVQAIDELEPCLIISRRAREDGIPLVEGWALPYANVRTFTSQTPSLEEAYGLPTRDRPISDISDDEFRQLGLQLILGLGSIEGIPQFYGDDALQNIAAGRIPSFAPMVWLTAALMALEALKVLLDWGTLALAPHFALYDPFQHRVPAQPSQPPSLVLGGRAGS